MEVLIVSGIWPPDVGGPASHGPDLGRFLLARGHTVRAITTVGESSPVDPGFPVASARRSGPRVVRVPRGAAAVLSATRGAEVIYATGMYGRSAVAAAARGIPLVLKLVSDPAYERARSLGLFKGTLEEFQEQRGHPALQALKRLRMAAVRKGSRVIIPSRYLAEIVRGWGLPQERISIIPNPAPPIQISAPRDVLRERLGLGSMTFVFAGRLVLQKNLPLAISAMRSVPDASLVLIGDGPERERLVAAIAAAGVGDRVSLKGALPRSEAIEWMRAADAAVLPSDWENFPHAAVEALTVGTPVIATSVGGVPEIVEPGVNGILVAPGDERAFGEAMASVAGPDSAALARLREGARLVGDRYREDVVFSAIEAELELARRAAA